MIEVISQIELVEIERDDEGCECRREFGRAEECEGEIWSAWFGVLAD